MPDEEFLYLCATFKNRIVELKNKEKELQKGRPRRH